MQYNIIIIRKKLLHLVSLKGAHCISKLKELANHYFQKFAFICQVENIVHIHGISYARCMSKKCILIMSLLFSITFNTGTSTCTCNLTC